MKTADTPRNTTRFRWLVAALAPSFVRSMPGFRRWVGGRWTHVTMMAHPHNAWRAIDEWCLEWKTQP